MAIIASTGKLRNKIESLWRVAESAWFGKDVSSWEQIPNILNGENLTGVNAAGTGTVSMLGVNSSDAVVMPNGLTIPAGQVLTNLGTSSTTTANALTALAGGAQAGTALTARINRVTTVTTAADSVQLPLATAGTIVTVINAAAANSMNIFPRTGQIINALSANTAIALAANKTIEFYCAVAGTWNSLLTA
jgi:hypothetical protein